MLEFCTRGPAMQARETGPPGRRNGSFEHREMPGKLPLLLGASVAETSLDVSSEVSYEPHSQNP
jgi:hypothetical protein